MSENYIKVQEDLLSKVGRGRINFKKAPKERITVAYIETRLETLEQQWNTFVSTHHKIVYESKKEELRNAEYSVNNVYDEMEEEYINYKALLKDTLSKFKSTATKTDDSNGRDSRKVFVKLPDISLPKFSGNYSEWASYKDLFTSLIHKNDSLDDVQRLHYLKGSLIGDAENLVKSITITASNYTICWDRLASRYDNKRSMANSIIRRLMNQRSITQESATAIRQLLDTTNECLQSLWNMKVSTDSWDLILIYVLSQKLDPESRSKWESRVSESSGELPTYKQLEEFLEMRFRSLEYKTPEKGQTSAAPTKSSHAVSTEPILCIFCSGPHKICNCKSFLMEGVEARRQFVQNRRLCFNCLSPKHSVYMCTVSTTCRQCKKRHHTLLHPKTPQLELESGKSEPQFERSKVVGVVTGETEEPLAIGAGEAENPEVVTTCFSTSRSTVLLATALVNVRALTKDSSASVLRSLLDQGSQASFVTESAVQHLGLKKIKETINVSGLGGSGILESRSSVNLQITSRSDPSFSLRVKAHVLDKLTALLPNKKVSINPTHMQILPSLVLADPSFERPAKIDLLLGAEVYSKIMMEGLIQGNNGSFIAQKTKLGWVLSGVVEDTVSKGQMSRHLNCHTVTIDRIEDDGNALLKKFWELESEPVLTDKILTEEERACEDLFTTTTKRDQSGRYVVKLPLKNKEPASSHGNSLDITHKRFLMLEKRLINNPSLKKEYSKVLDEYLSMGHMEVCVDKDKSNAVYLPHHAVVRDDKITSKVRVVFDASCKGMNGASLNGDLMVGPTLQPELRHLVMRWRCFPISICADIVKMYRQVRVADEDVDFQRILWRENRNDELRHFRLMRVTFGMSSAPYLAVRALQQLAYDEGSEFPLAADRVLSDFYMDDLMTGCHSVAEGIQVYEQMSKLLTRGGFPLQKWSSNSSDLLKAIGCKDSEPNLELKTDEVMKILGLSWNRQTDEFQFKVNLPSLSDGPVTKRKVTSDIARLFDPLGWLAPAVTTAKVFIQRLWLSGIGWDDPLPPVLLQDWLTYREHLVELEAFSIPRWISLSRNDICLELHGFSDASNVAFAAVVYARVVDKDKKVYVNLITSKTRVAPVKQVSIPRLELCGAALLSKLLNEVAGVLNVHKSDIHAWSDSTIVLAWLSSHPSRWKTFVANRVSDILTTMDGNQWSHVASKDNPADCASRGLQPAESVQNKLWRHGPDWLQNLTIDYGKGKVKDTSLDERTAKVCHVSALYDCELGEDLLGRFSSLKRLTRVIAICRRVLRWKKPERKQTKILDYGVTVKEINESLLTCVKICQKNNFSEEIQSLRSSGMVKKKSKLAPFNPFLDEDQMLRVGGRLHNALINEDTKHPILIPHKSHFTNLLIADAHERTLHGGPQLVLNYLRSRYWVIGAKSVVRQYVRKCITCVRHSRQDNHQRMGLLPAARVTAHRSFLRCGVDYAGPISIRPTKGRGYRSTKGYISVFVCMATRAVHLEVVSDMTSEAFLAAFKRFSARRGHIAEMWSDNGTTFVGAARQLKELFDVESSSVAVEIADWLASNGTAWHFIPPHSPNFGGLWEAAVKSTKFHLVRVIGTRTLTFEEMSTTLSQIEACLNSRPICQMPSDPSDPCPLTPGHFLVGEPLVLVPETNYEASNIDTLQRWHLTQRIVQDFWRRWSEEYLTQLQLRYKWQNQIPEPGVGDVVLIKEDGLPPARWLFGRVMEKYPGTDGLTRVVTLKCKGQTIIKRPISKLIILPKSH